MSNQFSQEIQGLRALAVSSVLIYHVWPDFLPGGFVGVDVFFVISGYLITGILLKEISVNGCISLSKFYSRRINRLLPASALVIFVSLSFFWLLPPIEWFSTAKQALASTFYIQNWYLGFQSIDYLASEEGASIFQHFWSLAVEEQFYVVWPALIILFSSLPKRPCQKTLYIKFAIGGILITSFVYCVITTLKNPSWAYFSTFVRAWELALGGGVACFSRHENAGNKMRGMCFMFGMCLIIFSCITFSKETLFPGYYAVLPTLGAVLVIFASVSGGVLGASAILRVKPVQYLGDISYSLYLWHWPVIIYFQKVYGSNLLLHHQIFIIVGSILLSHYSKYFVEDKFRNIGQRKALRVLSVCTILPIFGFLFIQHLVSHPLLVEKLNANVAVSAEAARKDLPEVYKLRCHTNQKTEVPNPCYFGSSAAAIKIALLGDSHAAQWVPALRKIADKQNVEIISFTKSACNVSSNIVYNKKVRYLACEKWRESAINSIIELKPTLIIITQSRNYKLFPDPSAINREQVIADGMVSTVNRFQQHGIKVLLIDDTPHITIDVPVCLSKYSHDIVNCEAEKKAKPDPIQLAVQSRKINSISMNQFICGASICMPMINDIVVWRDKHHITATFSKELSDQLWVEILDVYPTILEAAR